MAKKLEDQKILDATINNVFRQVLKTEPEHRSQSKKKVSTSSHGGEVLFNFCNLIEYQISHMFQTCEICENQNI